MEHKKENRKKRSEDCLCDLWDNIKHTNICIIGLLKKGLGEISDEITAENSLTWERKQSYKSRKCRVPGRIKLKRNMPRHRVTLEAK